MGASETAMEVDDVLRVLDSSAGRKSRGPRSESCDRTRYRLGHFEWTLSHSSATIAGNGGRAEASSRRTCCSRGDGVAESGLTTKRVFRSYGEMPLLTLIVKGAQRSFSAETSIRTRERDRVKPFLVLRHHAIPLSPPDFVCAPSCDVFVAHSSVVTESDFYRVSKAPPLFEGRGYAHFSKSGSALKLW